MICSLAQHVRMDRERHLGSHAEALDQLLEAIRRHRCSPLADEHVASWLLLALQTAQRPQLGFASMIVGSATEPPGFTSRAKRAARGSNSCNSPICLPAMSVAMSVMPVTLPPAG